MINHGTRGGYYAHKRLSEPPCDACRASINEYMQEYRTRPENVSAERKRARSADKRRRMAFKILKDRHLEEYRQILDDLRSL